VSDTEILKKCIIKVRLNGWIGIYCKELPTQYINSIIFSHEFAKAFWGFDQIPLLIKGGNFNMIKDSIKGIDWDIEWEYNLKQMVLEKEPLKYLEKFLDV